MNRANRRLIVGLAAALVLLSGCVVDESSYPETLPCDQPTQKVILGGPTKVRGPAEITTSGGELWASIDEGLDAGFFGEVEVVTLSVGEAESRPEFRDNDADPSNALTQVKVAVDRFTSFGLDQGRYWLVITDGDGLTVTSCEPGASLEITG